MDERQLIDALTKVNTLSQDIKTALYDRNITHAESVLAERSVLLKTIPPLESLAISNNILDKAVEILNEVEHIDSVGLKNASNQKKEIQTKLSAGVKAQKAILTYLDHKV